MGYINIVLQCGSIQNHKIENNAFESEKKKFIYCSEHYCMHCCNFLIAKKIKINATHIALTKDSQCYDFTIHRIRTVLSVAYQIARRIGSFCDEKKRIAFCICCFRTLPYLKMKYSGRVILLKMYVYALLYQFFPFSRPFFLINFLTSF